MARDVREWVTMYREKLRLPACNSAGCRASTELVNYIVEHDAFDGWRELLHFENGHIIDLAHLTADERRAAKADTEETE